MKNYILIIAGIFSLAGALYSPAARAEDENGNPTASDTELMRSTDDPQPNQQYDKVPGQPAPGSAEDPNLYHCGATSACN